MSDPNAWPNFLVIGAGKSGTTSVWSYLNQHPSVYMSPVKEPMYFCSDDYVARPGDPDYLMHAHATRSLDDYLALFADRTTEPVAGEASTAYLPDPGAPARIYAALPDAKLVAILRHPAERAHSDYAYSRSWGIETLPTFEQAIAAELAAGRDTPSSRRFIQDGFYGAQLDRYLALFPASQLRIYLFDDLIDDPRTVMRDLYGFVGVDDSIQADLSTIHNPASPVPRSARLEQMRRTFRHSGLTRRIPTGLRHLMGPALSRLNDTVPELPQSVRRQLIDLYAEDIERVEQIVGVDLSAWRR